MEREFNISAARTLIGLANDMLQGRIQASLWEMDEENGEFIVKFYKRNPCKFQADLS